MNQYNQILIKEIKVEVKRANRPKFIETKAIVGGTIAGVGAPVGVVSTVAAFGAASTGTAISTLSGAAATNATFAAIGGGSLATGGGGMLLGVSILTGGGVLLALLVGYGIIKWQMK